MPNGHESIPRWGSPLILLAMVVSGIVLFGQTPRPMLAFATLALSVLFGWRLSFHITMWDATEYGGAYTDKETMEVVRRRYVVATTLACSISAVLVAGVLAAIWHSS